MSNGKPVLFRVVNESGVPVEGAFVSVVRSNVAFPEIALVTDRSGVVQLSLPKGRFVIGANAEGERYGEMEVDSTGGDLGEVVVLTVSPAQ
jgi:hypothetical protein